MERNNVSDVHHTRIGIADADAVDVAVSSATGPQTLTLYFRFDRQAAARKTNRRTARVIPREN